MEHFKKYALQILLFTLIISTIAICYFAYRGEHKERYLKVAFLDIGQGDSIYIEAPNGKQMLIDGGPNAIVLSRLASVMPFGDRSLDLVLATHTDADHIGGLPAILGKYKVGSFIGNGAESDTKIFQTLEEKISKNKVPKITARKGMHIILDKEKNVYFDILFPDRDIGGLESNEGSIVGKLTYGESSFMLTGDATLYTENLIMQTHIAEVLRSDVLKLGHHGSRTSSSVLFLEKVDPEIAVISAGLHNRYGHPHPDIVERLSRMSIPYISTYEKGTIIFETDGKDITRR
ncbi:MAG: MBL fold metallo-hydrolase [Patescibacteria group bacterium]